MFYFVIMAPVVLLSILHFTPAKVRHHLSGMVLMFYCALVAFRGGGGSDTFLYEGVYYGTFDYKPFPEPALYYVFDFLNTLGISFDGFLLLQAILIFFSLRVILKKLGPLFLAFYVVYFGLNIDFSTLRQSVALHLIHVFFYYSKGWQGILLSSLFHASSLLTFVFDRKKLLISSLLLLLTLPFAYYFLSRYLVDGFNFLIRTDYTWVPQSLFLVTFLVLNGVGFFYLSIFVCLSYFPIGYRLSAYALIRLSSSRVINVRVLMSAVVLLIYSHLKIVSFEAQSLSNDGVNSLALHYNEVLKL